MAASKADRLGALLEPGNHVALVLLPGSVEPFDAMREAFEGLDWERFAPFCFERSADDLPRFIPADRLPLVEQHPKSYVEGEAFDLEGMKSFARERALTAERAGKVALGIFPFTSENLLLFRNPHTYAVDAERWVTEFLKGRQGTALCVYRHTDLERAASSPERLGAFFLGILGHSCAVAFRSGGGALSTPEVLAELVETCDPDRVPTEVLRRLDPDPLRRFNERVHRGAMERRKAAEEILRGQEGFVRAHSGKVVAVYLEERRIAGVGNTLGEALDEAERAHGRRRYVLVHIPPSEPYVLH